MKGRKAECDSAISAPHAFKDGRWCELPVHRGSHIATPGREDEYEVMNKTLISLALAGLVGLGVVSVPAEAGSAAVGTITVTGTGSMILKRDQATTNLAVTALADKAANAMAQATSSYNIVRKAILDLGIRPDNLTTTGISLYPEWTYPQNGGKPILSGYRAYVSVQVTTNVPNSARVLDAVMSVGGDAVSIGGISFDVADPEAVSDTSRVRAVANAKTKARDYAEALGQRIGRALKVVETSAAIPMPIYRSMAKADAGSVLEIDPGTQKVTSSVSIIFALID